MIFMGDMGSNLIRYNGGAFTTKANILTNLATCNGILSLAVTWNRNHIVVGCTGSRVFLLERSGTNYTQVQNVSAGSK